MLWICHTFYSFLEPTFKYIVTNFRDLDKHNTCSLVRVIRWIEAIESLHLCKLWTFFLLERSSKWRKATSPPLIISLLRSDLSLWRAWWRCLKLSFNWAWCESNKYIWFCLCFIFTFRWKSIIIVDWELDYFDIVDGCSATFQTSHPIEPIIVIICMLKNVQSQKNLILWLLVASHLC